MTSALALGRKLHGRSHDGMLALPVSPQVSAALARMPERDWPHTPINVIGSGIAGIHAQRLAELMRDANGADVNIPMPPAVQPIHAVRRKVAA